MGSARLQVLAFATMVSCQSPPAMAQQDFRALFPDAAASPKADGAPRRIGDVGITALRYEPRPEASELRNAFRCGVVLASGGASQAIVTIGTGFSEAVSCNGLVEAGMIVPAAGSPRLALIYRTSSPNAAGKTPVILMRKTGKSGWEIDEEASARLSEASETPTLANVRKRLGAK